MPALITRAASRIGCLVAASGAILALGAGTCHAYKISSPFHSQHFTVNQVILDKHEQFDDNFRQMLMNDNSVVPADNSKLLVTTAVFAHGSKGMDAGIREPLLGILSATSFHSGDRISGATWVKGARYASEIGLYLTPRELLGLVDYRLTLPLLDELATLPLVIQDFEVQLRTIDFQRRLFFTLKNKGMVLDFQAIDSLFYTKAEMGAIKAGCKLTIMGLPDRVLGRGEVPLFISMHGAINDIDCPKEESKR